MSTNQDFDALDHMKYDLFGYFLIHCSDEDQERLVKELARITGSSEFNPFRSESNDSGHVLRHAIITSKKHFNLFLTFYATRTDCVQEYLFKIGQELGDYKKKIQDSMPHVGIIHRAGTPLNIPQIARAEYAAETKRVALPGSRMPAFGIYIMNCPEPEHGSETAAGKLRAICRHEHFSPYMSQTHPGGQALGHEVIKGDGFYNVAFSVLATDLDVADEFIKKIDEYLNPERKRKARSDVGTVYTLETSPKDRTGTQAAAM